MFWNRKPAHSLSDDQISSIIADDVALARHIGVVGLDELALLTRELIETRTWHPLDGLELTPQVLVTIAANASIPVLGLHLWIYRMVKEIIVRPGVDTGHRVAAAPAHGVLTSGVMSTIGETAPNSGPLALSWSAVLAHSRNPAAGHNVVIHEFAHKIDMSDGYADGAPPLRPQALEQWSILFDDEFGHAEARASDDVLDDYAWTNPAEFFAVSSETFFCRPKALAAAKPQLYLALAGFYGQDPAGAGLAA